MPFAPLAVRIPLAAVLLLLAAPSAITAYRAWTYAVRRHGRLGLHTPAAMLSDEAFGLANRVAAPLMAGAAGVGAVCAVLVLALPVGIAGAVVLAVLGFVGLVGQWMAALTLGDRAAMTVPRPARRPASGGSCCSSCSCGGAGCDGASASTAGGSTSQSTATVPTTQQVRDSARA